MDYPTDREHHDFATHLDSISLPLPITRLQHPLSQEENLDFATHSLDSLPLHPGHNSTSSSTSLPRGRGEEVGQSCGSEEVKEDVVNQGSG